MSELEQSNFEGWAIVELMGHVRLSGHVTTQAFGGVVLFRVDIPGIPERRDGQGCYEAVQPYTQFVGAGSIYRMTPCTEETARRAQEASVARPWHALSLPEGSSYGGSPDDDEGLMDGDANDEGGES